MDWQPGQELCIRLADETGEQRTEAQIKGMVEEVACAANKSNFDVSTFGSWDSMKLAGTCEVHQEVLSAPHNSVRKHRGSLPLFYQGDNDGEWLFWGWCDDLDQAKEQAAKLKEQGKKVGYCFQFVEYQGD